MNILINDTKFPYLRYKTTEVNDFKNIFNKSVKQNYCKRDIDEYAQCYIELLDAQTQKIGIVANDVTSEKDRPF